MTAPGVAWAARIAAIYQAALAGRVAAGAKGISTGSSVGSLTRSATCGRQGSAVAYHWPSRVVDCSLSRRVGGPMRSSSFFVARTMSTRPSCRSTTTLGHADALLCRCTRGGTGAGPPVWPVRELAAALPLRQPLPLLVGCACACCLLCMLLPVGFALSGAEAEE